MDSTVLTSVIASHRWLNSHFALFKADTNCGYPSPLSHSHSNEQRHAHARARRGVWLWMSRWEGLHQFLLLLWRLPLRSLAAWQVAHPRRQDRLVCTYLLPNCFCALQSGLLGLLSLSLGAGMYTVLLHCFTPFLHMLLRHAANDILKKGTHWEIPNLTFKYFHYFFSL